MSALWLARAKIHDPAQYRKYNEAARALWDDYPREVLARGGRFVVLEGQTHYERFVVQRFASFDLALSYFNSPGYQEAAAFRRGGAAQNELVLVEGTSSGGEDAAR